MLCIRKDSDNSKRPIILTTLHVNDKLGDLTQAGDIEQFLKKLIKAYGNDNNR